MTVVTQQDNIYFAMISGKKVPPSAEELAEKFLKRTEFITDPQNTSLLFTFFAQHFTHCFFKTEYHRHSGMTWGRHGVDSSHIYGQGGERESKLRTSKDGKMKSQVISHARMHAHTHAHSWVILDYSNGIN